MDFFPDSDQAALVAATRQYVESRFPLSDSPAYFDDVLWKEISELGWLGLAVGEEAGGAGASLLDEVFVFREIGRGVVGGPILTTLAAARLAAWTGDSALARELINGHTRVARGVGLPGSDNGGILLLDTDGSTLTLFTEENFVALYRTPQHLASTPGLEDETFVSHTTYSELGDPCLKADDPATVSRIRRVLSILASAQLAGIAGMTSELATNYAKNRVQFGKPIGAFQAVKHKCADMATNALAADNITYFAALAEGANEVGSNYHTLAAAALCRRAALTNSRSNIQIHGAMGFTVEDSAHRFVKRTHALCLTEEFSCAAALLGGLPPADDDEEA
ncbi:MULTISPECIES: acyl-CoA dehydrogenase family protein [unclassified Mycobacterium]|uniref:acyl-CoA dehydrogenase family protein n=1 Tax=unclassified Mycobacterium TaxID=2642494 RepID=UPI0029C74453|nr:MULTISPECIES: acyl-CoA dehydrogenase family protein [unclassified Mycobacterium]